MAVRRDFDWLAPECWAHDLGLVPADLAGRLGPSALRRSGHRVLLDGRRASFSMVAASNPSPGEIEEWLSWAWSAELGHVLILDAQRGLIGVTRWDRGADEGRWYRPPGSLDGASALIGSLRNETELEGSWSADYVLQRFRQVRALLADYDGLTAIGILNALLLGTESVLAGTVEADAWHRAQTVADALRLLSDDQVELAGACDLAPAVRALPVGVTCDEFLSSHRFGVRPLSPTLLLRYASGRLYQEAQVIVQPPVDRHLPGLAPDERPVGRARSDVRFTPPPLVRALVEAAMDSLPPGWLARPDLTVLDPACGSGVFLMEAVKAAVRRGYRGRLHLHGIDIMAEAGAITRFCVERTLADEGLSGASLLTVCADSLAHEWPKSDLILTNPPFVDHRSQTAEQRSAVADLLGDLAGARPDYAMAFIWRAIGKLSPGGVVASVLPASLLATRTGARWREVIASETTIHLIAQLDSYGYFEQTMIKPAFIVAARRPANGNQTRTLLTGPGREEQGFQVLRGWRQPGAGRDDLVDSRVPQSSLVSSVWTPSRPPLLAPGSLPVVGELFDVKQGALTGCNEAFILLPDELESLGPEERRWFRPAVMPESFDRGRLVVSHWVFYPYGPRGILIASEEELARSAPSYYASHLLPHRTHLCETERVGGLWWSLVRPRAWQRQRVPKLVSGYFGGAGRFAIDRTGDHVVVQGYAWLPNAGGPLLNSFGEEGAAAYLALLNSKLFEEVASHACDRVQGGQLNLSRRFVESVPIPDLRMPAFARHRRNLAKIGSCIELGEPVDLGGLNDVVAQVYGIDVHRRGQDAAAAEPLTADERPWSGVAWFEQELQVLLSQEDTIRERDLTPPNQVALATARRAAGLAAESGLPVARMALSPDDGMVLGIRVGSWRAEIECYNDGEVVGMVAPSPRAEAEFWTTAGDEQSLVECIGRIKGRVYGEPR